MLVTDAEKANKRRRSAVSRDSPISSGLVLPNETFDCSLSDSQRREKLINSQVQAFVEKEAQPQALLNVEAASLKIRAERLRTTLASDPTLTKKFSSLKVKLPPLILHGGHDEVQARLDTKVAELQQELHRKTLALLIEGYEDAIQHAEEHARNTLNKRCDELQNCIQPLVDAEHDGAILRRAESWFKERVTLLTDALTPAVPKPRTQTPQPQAPNGASNVVDANMEDVDSVPATPEEKSKPSSMVATTTHSNNSMVDAIAQKVLSLLKKEKITPSTQPKATKAKGTSKREMPSTPSTKKAQSTYVEDPSIKTDAPKGAKVTTPSTAKKVQPNKTNFRRGSRGTPRTSEYTNTRPQVGNTQTPFPQYAHAWPHMHPWSFPPPLLHISPPPPPPPTYAWRPYQGNGRAQPPTSSP
jgi:hypothetical protein